MNYIKFMMMALMTCFMLNSCSNKKEFDSKSGKIKLNEYTDSISFTNFSEVNTEDSIVNIVNIVTPICKRSCKNPLTFIPRDVSIMDIQKDTIIVDLNFEAKNSFGVPGELIGHFVIANGIEIEDKRLIFDK